MTASTDSIVATQVRLSRTLHTRLKEAARRKGRSLNHEIARRLRNSLMLDYLRDADEAGKMREKT